MALKPKPNYSIRLMYLISRFSYYTGLGECWYDAPVRSSLNKIIYPVLSFLSILFISTIMSMEISSLFKKRLTENEKYDAVLFCVTHPFIFGKSLTIRFKKERIKKFLRVLLVETKQLFVDESFEKAQVKKAIIHSVILTVSALLTMILTAVEAARKHFKYGVPMRTIVTYYPDYDDMSWQASLMRSVAQYYWWHLVAGMLATDFLAVTSLIYVSFQFKTLQKYFKSLGDGFERNELGKSRIELENDMNKAFVAGIKLHSSVLWCAQEIQNSLGNIYSFQVTQSVAAMSLCLVKIVNSELNLTNLTAMGMFITCILILTGTYMWSAGDITLEAALVGDAMFHSGWHLCSARARMRPLLILGIQQSQVPVVMTAFGVVELSYENFIVIIKRSYSVFAVFY